MLFYQRWSMWNVKLYGKKQFIFKHAHDFTVEDACIFQITATCKNKTSEIPFKLNKITVLAFKYTFIQNTSRKEISK